MFLLFYKKQYIQDHNYMKQYKVFIKIKYRQHNTIDVAELFTNFFGLLICDISEIRRLLLLGTLAKIET